VSVLTTVLSFDRTWLDQNEESLQADLDPQVPLRLSCPPPQHLIGNLVRPPPPKERVMCCHKWWLPR
jgi:hypothetical protein